MSENTTTDVDETEVAETETTTDAPEGADPVGSTETT